MEELILKFILLPISIWIQTELTSPNLNSWLLNSNNTLVYMANLYLFDVVLVSHSYRKKVKVYFYLITANYDVPFHMLPPWEAFNGLCINQVLAV